MPDSPFATDAGWAVSDAAAAGLPGLLAAGTGAGDGARGAGDAGAQWTPPVLGSPSRKARAWTDDYGEIRRWFERKPELHRLDAALGGEVLVLEDFLPAHVASDLLHAVSSLPAGQWNPTEAGKDYGSNNIEHRFLSSKGSADAAAGSPSGRIAAVLRVFNEAVLPGRLAAFSVARYGRRDHIEPHDDKAHSTFEIEGEHVVCSRDIAMILYLSPEWGTADGGAFVDLGENTGQGTGTGRRIVPKFNSAVLFRIPRMHMVEAVTAAQKLRFSAFGWFYHEGVAYSVP